jgi:hypothetical protein
MGQRLLQHHLIAEFVPDPLLQLFDGYPAPHSQPSIDQVEEPRPADFDRPPPR